METTRSRFTFGRARTLIGYVAATAMLAIGVLALVNPLLVAPLLGLEVIAPRGLSQMRGYFGGILTMMGAASLWALPNRPRFGSWLRLVGLIWSADAVGRLVGMILDGAWTPGSILLFAIVAIFAAGLLLASIEDPKRRRAASDATGS
jgi:hypothetical protein